ncbi:MAG: 50S ribosomal protein L7Ae-like protein [Acholeplasmataceae bacterium]|nr:ribosomal L7Ae/L30e/S12e/Gadd45 family protein [Acidaminococcaceae bacterium]NLY84117.1 50S ribosomal protein L7Ae-like protein [Acholeplasmataceae bacterium]
MSMELLKAGAKHVIGVKQTAKAIEKGTAKIVFVASDAEAGVVEPLLRACAEAGLAYEETATMQELGKACGIHVGAAAAAILKD